MGISTLQKASLHVAGRNSFARVIFLSWGEREDSHSGAQPYRTCTGNWWGEKLTSVCCGQQVIHHVILEGFTLLTLLSTWCLGMLLCILPQPQRRSPAINQGSGIWVSERNRGSLYLDILQSPCVMIK